MRPARVSSFNGDDEVVLDDARDAHVTSKKAFAYRLRDWHASNMVDRATLQSFYAAFFAGNLTTPFLRSQPIVGSLDDAPLRAREASEEGRVVTMSSRARRGRRPRLSGAVPRALVRPLRPVDEDDDRDFLVLFHAPWCSSRPYCEEVHRCCDARLGSSSPSGGELSGAWGLHCVHLGGCVRVTRRRTKSGTWTSTSSRPSSLFDARGSPTSETA